MTSSVDTTIKCLADEQGGLTWVLDSDAADTIGQLEDEGYTVTIDRNGGGGLEDCIVTGVRNPITSTQVSRRSQSTNDQGQHETIIITKTIQVSLDCPPVKPPS